LAKLRSEYAPFLVDREPDVWIDLDAPKSLTIPEVQHVVDNLTTSFDGRRFATDPEMIECIVDWSNWVVSFTVEREVFDPRIDYKPMNLLFRGIYYAIHKWKRRAVPDAYLVHGCGLLDERKGGYLFTGPSGIGKSTVAKLAQSRAVMNDEAVLVRRQEGRYRIEGTPLEGDLRPTSNSSADLAAIFFLKQAIDVSVRKLGVVDACTRLLGQVMETTPLFDTSGNGSMDERMGVCATLAESVPVYELCFRRDASFWAAVEAI
jgi:hypothetical protein